jgi:hypothetical protein
MLMLCIFQQDDVPIQVVPQGWKIKDNTFATIDEVLMRNRRPLGLSIPCMGSRFDKIPFPDEE